MYLFDNYVLGEEFFKEQVHQSFATNPDKNIAQFRIDESDNLNFD